MRSPSLSIPDGPRNAVGNRQCAAVRRNIALHFKESLTLDLLAEEPHMNRYFLSQAFSHTQGVTTMEYRRKTKMYR